MLFTVNPINALRTRRKPTPLQQHAEPPVTISRTLSSQRDQLVPQHRVVVGSRLISIAGTIHAHELASLALAVAILGNHQRHILPATYKLQPFFRITAFSASRSRLRSATMCFSRRFSSSSSFNRRASLTSRPPYLLFQV